MRRIALLALVLASCATTTRPPPEPIPRTTDTYIPGPDTPEECAAAYPDRARCRWTVEIVGAYTPCCGDWTGGPYCICHTCETDADCGEGAACRSLTGRGQLPTASVCVPDDHPCAPEGAGCPQGFECANENGEVICAELEPTPV
ncbi:hypothetical protein [Sandaracinus amylolyticus]|uniref:hypothetical protein n=1 Tax=Sandaracinus amylolyticus TaxID=927083 RepID=UPI001F1B8BE5|nr:hypothetical protein [Sandaracinus amylolyticus]UJR78827.1 Hypothetical protein I5071_8600 [Sandaracinus amylolyticus]